eukprot:gene12037-15139_t
MASYYPMLVVAALMHSTKHISEMAEKSASADMLYGAATSYAFVGLALPAIARLFVNALSKPGRLAHFLNKPLCVLVQCVLVTDLMLRAPVLIEPLQDWAKRSSVLAYFTEAVLAPPRGGSAYGYGARSTVCTQVAVITLGFASVSSFILEVAEAPEILQARRSPPSALANAVFKNNSLEPLVIYLRRLPFTRKVVLCAVACVALLQMGGVTSIVVQLVLAVFYNTVTNSTPAILLLIMLGVGVEVAGVMYITSDLQASEDEVHEFDSMSYR